MIDTSTGLLIGAGLLGLFPILRPLRARNLSQRMAKIAHSAYKEAKERGKEADPTFVKFHDQTEALCVMIPVAASGVMPNPLNYRGTGKRSELWEYLDENAWLLPYVAGSACVFCSAIALGKPFSVRHWGKYLVCRLALMTLSDADGGLMKTPTQSEVETFEARVEKAKENTRNKGVMMPA